MTIHTHINPDVWIRRLFSEQNALNGGIVRRPVRDVDLIMGRAAFAEEVRRRGFHAFENRGQYVVFCNRDQLRIVD